MNTVLLTAAASLGVRIWAYAVRHGERVVGKRTSWMDSGSMGRKGSGTYTLQTHSTWLDPALPLLRTCSCCRASACTGWW